MRYIETGAGAPVAGQPIAVISDGVSSVALGELSDGNDLLAVDDVIFSRRAGGAAPANGSVDFSTARGSILAGTSVLKIHAMASGDSVPSLDHTGNTSVYTTVLGTGSVTLGYEIVAAVGSDIYQLPVTFTPASVYWGGQAWVVSPITSVEEVVVGSAGSGVLTFPTVTCVGPGEQILYLVQHETAAGTASSFRLSAVDSEITDGEAGFLSGVGTVWEKARPQPGGDPVSYPPYYPLKLTANGAFPPLYGEVSTAAGAMPARTVTTSDPAVLTTFRCI